MYAPHACLEPVEARSGHFIVELELETVVICYVCMLGT